MIVTQFVMTFPSPKYSVMPNGCLHPRVAEQERGEAGDRVA